MRRRFIVGAAIALSAAVTVVAAADRFQVQPQNFDPGHSFLVQAAWLNGIGCPTNATYHPYDATTPNNLGPATSYTDPACPTGDMSDRQNQGLLLAKTGPTANFAAAVAVIKGVKGPITELGYDIRKPGANVNDPRGSHCGAGAPRFDITMQNGDTYFIGCDSPPPTMDTPGTGWQRLRWGGSTPLMAFGPSGTLVDISHMNAKSIEIVFDEGQDPSGGPDQFGLAVLDNVDVNGVLVGHGPGGNGDHGDQNECNGHGHGKGHDDCDDND